MPRPVLRALAALVPIAIAALPLVACHRTSDGDAITSTNDPTKSPPKTPTPTPAKPKGPEPKDHRVAAVACAAGPTKGNVVPAPSGSASAPPGTTAAGPDAACTKDSDCKEGKNGRCAMTGGGRRRPQPGCVYDTCFNDAECGAKSECVCGSTGVGNHCRPGNCATDGDCGGAYCSPSYGLSCGPFGGIHGNFCHTSDDECTSDEDCPLKGSERGYCAWHPDAGRWKCGYNHCVG
jgi:hypothetical protein